MALDEVVGSSPYGATTIAGGQGQRQPSAIELEGARFQGKLIAETANKLLAERRPTHKDVMGLISQSVIARGKSRTTQGHADPAIISVTRSNRVEIADFGAASHEKTQRRTDRTFTRNPGDQQRHGH
jgi:hypothetical protein